MPASKDNKHLPDRNLLTILLFTLIVIVLFFGLRPKTWPLANEAHWLPDDKALKFRNPGIAYVDNVYAFSKDLHSEEFTLHLSAAPENIEKKGFRPILMMHDGNDHHQLTIWHWGKSIIVMNGDDYDYTKRLPRISADNALISGQPSFITVTSGNHGTRLFIDGELVRESKN